MSGNINTNKLKFTIYGAGHDYTLNNSGTGEGERVFSHPYVPLNSIHYAGMWKFYVAGENGDLIDAVKDDLSHCTFTPPLGTAFTSEGETEIQVHYHREYVQSESTLIVDRKFKEKITVVNHGTVTTQGNTSPSNRPERDILRDIYSDGYCFWRPYNANTVRESYYHSAQNEPYPYVERAIKKTSSVPWRAKGLGYSDYPFAWWRNLEDISELEFVDTSNCDQFNNLFMRIDYNHYSPLMDLSPISNWDTSKVKIFRFLINGLHLYDMTAFSKWDTSSLEDLSYAFSGTIVQSFHGIENWNTSKVTSMRNLLSQYDARLYGATPNVMPSLDPFKNWDTSKNKSLQSAFYGSRVQNFHGWKDWDMSKVTTFYDFMRNGDVIDGIADTVNWDFSSASNIREMFYTNGGTRDASPAQSWNVSGTDLGAFNNNWINIPSWN